MVACWSSAPEGLPLVVYLDECSADAGRLAEELSHEVYRAVGRYYGVPPRHEEAAAWRGELNALIGELQEAPYVLLLEYPILGGLARADAILLGRGSALVVEAKGWKRLKIIDEISAEADQVIVPNPCYQMQSYVYKLRYLYPFGDRVHADGAVYAYRSPTRWDIPCRCVLRGELRGLAEKILRDGPREEEVRLFIEDGFQLRRDLVAILSQALKEGVEKALGEMLSSGYGLAGDQAKLVAEVLKALESGERWAFLVEGASGSGKTLVAITIFLAALARGYKALLGYVNNRLVNVLRIAVRDALRGSGGEAVHKLIGFSQVGGRRGSRGFCEPKSRYGDIDLLVVDEAQRLTRNVVETCFTRPARVIVAFYDDRQVLLGNEAGTGRALEEAARASGRRVEKRLLPSPVRVPRGHLEMVEALLWGGPPRSSPLKVRIYYNIENMLRDLEAERRRGRRIALVCAFTESEGDKNDPLNWGNPRNIRIGYPLQSGFDHYKGLDLRVKWLMEPKIEYARYWMQKFHELAKLYEKDPAAPKPFRPVHVCSSVYGAQGMEAEVVGVVWGRDLVWRGKWAVQPDPITDNIGGRKSLRSIARKNPARALELLRNRYYIMLTRATRAIYLYFEDDETEKHVHAWLKSAAGGAGN
ncbi:MAG: DUF2075 domain-containing protein [Desulfurococcales archaeon]|nr:DUF2075 domain-containing protein [Desulfurococcales archaeon]